MARAVGAGATTAPGYLDMHGTDDGIRAVSNVGSNFAHVVKRRHARKRIRMALDERREPRATTES